MKKKFKEMTFRDERVMRLASKDITFTEEILRILMFEDSLYLSSIEEDKIIYLDGMPVFIFDFVAKGKKKGIYGICLLDHYDDEMEQRILYVQGLLRNEYDQDNSRDDLYTICICIGDENKKYPYYIPGISLIHFEKQSEIIDYGIRIFVLQKIENPLSLLESVINDFYQEKPADIQNDFMKEKLAWTVWELENSD